MVRARQVRSRRTPLGQLGVLFLVVVVAAAGVLAWVVSYTRATPAGGAPANGVAPASGTPELTGTVSPIDLFSWPQADPFTGTPADHWADGAAGIVAPAARQTGVFTPAQVAAAYAMTRRMLIAANLDERTLLGGPPTAFASLLTVSQRAVFLAGLNKTGVDRAGYPLSSRSWVASFAPGSTELIGNVIKVHGTMSARAVRESGTTVLAISVNYRFGYAVEPPHDPTDWMRVVDHEYGAIDFARWDGPRGALEPWDNAVIENAGAACGTADGYIHPDYPSERSIDIRQFGPAVYPYSSAARVPGDGAGCALTTGA